MSGIYLKIGHKRSALAAVAGLLLLLAAYAAPAATPTPRAAPGTATKPPSSNFNREWAELIEAARREGRLDMLGWAAWTSESGTFIKLVKAFEKEFGILVKSSRGSTTDQVERVLAERRAGVYTMDVVIGGGGTFTKNLIPSGVLAPIKPLLFHPEVVKESLWKSGRHLYMDPGQQYVLIIGARNAPVGISINTKLVRPGEIKSFWDLLNPKWRGRIVAYHPIATRQEVTYSQVYHDKKSGPEFLRRLFSEAKLNYVTTVREFSEGLAGGARAVGFLEGAAQREIREMKRQGLPVNLFFSYDIGRDIALANPGGSIMGVFGKAPHPNALRLFVNWLLTREVQLQFNRVDGDYESLRADVSNDAVVPELRLPKNFYIPEADPQFPEKESQANNFVRKLVVELGL
jgi:ABC-type Fe3+ transport system substrate-binding protein